MLKNLTLIAIVYYLFLVSIRYLNTSKNNTTVYHSRHIKIVALQHVGYQLLFTVLVFPCPICPKHKDIIQLHLPNRHVSYLKTNCPADNFYLGSQPGTIDMDLITTGVSASERMRRESLVSLTRSIIMEKMQLGGPSIRQLEVR